jgi:hypothetical protein
MAATGLHKNMTVIINLANQRWEEGQRARDNGNTTTSAAMCSKARRGRLLPGLGFDDAGDRRQRRHDELRGVATSFCERALRPVVR